MTNSATTKQPSTVRCGRFLVTHDSPINGPTRVTCGREWLHAGRHVGGGRSWGYGEQERYDDETGV